MSDSALSSLIQLPLEILYGIFRYLDISDIARIRRVSRLLNGASRIRDVWSDAYRTAEFVRPPGPFLSQSAHDLEKALVPSFRLDRNLRYGGGPSQNEIATLRLREIRFTGVDLRVCLVFGRFLFIAFSEEVRCYDLNRDAFDSNSGANIIYRSTEGAVRSFYCISAIDVQGRPFACVVLSEALQTAPRLSIFSFNVGEESEVTLDLLHQSEYSMLDVDSVILGPRVIVVEGQGPDCSGEWRYNHIIALDVLTRTQFMIPSFAHANRWQETGELPEWETVEDITSPTSISTSTHLLLAQSFYTQAEGWTTFLQAFALPPPHTHHRLTPTSTGTVTTLNPSHRGRIPGISVMQTILLHDAVLDSTTQDVLIAIRVHAYEPSRPRCAVSRYGIIRLNAASKSHDHDSEVSVGTMTFQLLGLLGQFPQTPFLHPSLNGAGRAFYTVEPGSYILSVLEYDLRVTGGNNDEHEAKVVEYPSILRFPTSRTLLDYDPYSGRLCLRSAMARYSVIEILDLAV